MVNGIEHVAVVSKDTAALKDWYMEMYGGRVVYDNGKGTYFLQFADGSMIEVHHDPPHALCDGAQSRTPAQCAHTAGKIFRIREAMEG